MEDGDENVVQQFFKRRRDLVLLSAFIWFINTLSIKLEKINFLGNELKISSPETMPLILAIILFYFSIRYLQYLHELPDTGFTGRMEKRLRMRMHKAIERGDYYPPAIREKVRTGNASVGWDISHNGSDLILRLYEQAADGSMTNTDVVLPFLTQIYFFIAITPHFMFRTRYFTDYMFPIVIAVSAAISFAPFI